jgi:hypothetical protein
MNIIQAISALFTNGGFSFNINNGDLNPSHGYMVAVSKDTERVISSAVRYKRSAIENEIKRFIQDNSQILANDNYVVGAWQNGKDLFLDVSELIEDIDEAISLAEQREQLAIYDNTNKETINLSSLKISQ